ncbi:MAG: DciA family protein [Arenicellales bacterium]|nr:DciA family protein [Arenicellales bacterium]
MSQRRKTLSPIKSLFTGSDQTLRQVTQGAVDLKPFQRAWNNILPNPACNFIQPAFFKDGTLTVWVHSPVWANWIRHRHNSILSRLQQQGLPKVHTLTVRLSLHTNIDPKTAKTSPGRKQPDEETRHIIKQAAQTIPDPELSKSLQRLVRTLKNSR